MNFNDCLRNGFIKKDTSAKDRVKKIYRDSYKISSFSKEKYRYARI